MSTRAPATGAACSSNASSRPSATYSSGTRWQARPCFSRAAAVAGPTAATTGPERHPAVLRAAREVAGEHAHRVGAREDDELIGGELAQDAEDGVVQRPRLDADGRYEQDLGAQGLETARAVRPPAPAAASRPRCGRRAAGPRGAARPRRAGSRRADLVQDLAGAALEQLGGEQGPESFGVVGRARTLAAHRARAVERAHVGGEREPARRRRRRPRGGRARRWAPGSRPRACRAGRARP